MNAKLPDNKKPDISSLYYHKPHSNETPLITTKIDFNDTTTTISSNTNVTNQAINQNHDNKNLNDNKTNSNVISSQNKSNSSNSQQDVLAKDTLEVMLQVYFS